MEKKETINRRILALALPAVASNITVPLLGLCDTAVTGHLGKAAYIAAIAAGGMMLNVVFWVFGFLRMGTTGMTAEAYGAKDNRQLACVISRSATLALLAGVMIVALSRPLGGLLQHIIGAEPEVAGLAMRYFEICIWEAPALLVTMSIVGWLIGMQNTVLPMIVSVSVNLINVMCSLTAVFILGLGFEGVAYGTLAANWIGVGIALLALRRLAAGRRLWCGLTGLASGGLKRFFSVSAELFLRSSCIMIVTVAVTSYGARLGDVTLAINSVMMQFFLLFSYFIDGFAFSGEALCGKSAGAEDYPALLASVKAICRWGGGIAVAFCVLYSLFLMPAVNLLTDVAEVRAGVGSMRVFVALIPPVSVAAFLFDGFFVGLTATRRMFVTTFAASAIFFAIMTLCPEGNNTLWIAFLTYLTVRGLGLACQLPAVIEQHKG